MASPQDLEPPPDSWHDPVESTPTPPATRTIIDHPCELCPAWGCFGFEDIHTRKKPTAWYCGDHREAGEQLSKRGNPPLEPEQRELFR